MKGRFEVTDRFGRLICYLTATGERQAVQLARDNGHATASRATWLKEA